MKYLATTSSLIVACLLLLLAPARAQTDHVTLTNGDQITGTVKALADGKLSFDSPLLGDLSIPIASIQDLKTAGTVHLLTTAGEELKRRITGVKDGALLLSASAEGGPAVPSLSLDNLDKINPPADPVPQWTGSVNIGASLNEGNTNRRSVTAGAEAIRRSAQDRITARGWWNYSDEKDSTTKDWNLSQRQVGAKLQYDYFLSKKAYVLATSTAEGDSQADLDLRYTAGVGLGYQWIEENDLKFSTEVGINYFVENFRTVGTPDDDYVAGRAAYNLEWVIGGSTRFLQNVEVFPSLEKSEDFYAKKDSRLQVTLTGSMFAQLQWVAHYDTTPSPGLDRIDSLYTLSVGWTF